MPLPQLGNIGLAVAAVVVLTKAVKGTSLAPLRVYLWAAGSAFVTWRITSTTVRRLVRLIVGLVESRVHVDFKTLLDE